MKSKREVLSTSMKRKSNQHSTLASSTNMLKSQSVASPIYKSSYNSHFFPQEESIEIKIPTPYPKNNYMLIEDPTLVNSKYTELLNEKYPPRKHLKHNLTSWMKCNKKMPQKDMNIKFLNPQIKFEDFGMKKLLYKGEDIDDVNNIKSLEDALNLIELLKAKVIEYELTNNRNIETSMEYMNSLKDENEFIKKKLVESYEKLNFVSEKYNIDNIDDIMHNSRDVLLESFRKKWLKINFFSQLKMRFYRMKYLRYNYANFINKRNNILRFKGLLCLEKNHMIKRYCKKIKSKRTYSVIKKIIESLRYNVFSNKITEKFQNIRRTIHLMVYMKELKLNVGHSRYFKTIKKKALFKYYLTLTSKAIRNLKHNILRFRNRKPNKIQYNKFFLDFDKKFNDKKISDVLLNKGVKTKKAKGLFKMKKLLDKIIERDNNKIINHKNKLYPSEIYFNKWKAATFLINKELQVRVNCKKASIKLFLSKIKERVNRRKLKVSHSIKGFYFNRFFRLTEQELKMKKKVEQFKRKVLVRSVFESLHKIITNEPLIRFKRLHRKFQISLFVDNLRENIKMRQKEKFLNKIVKKTQVKLNEMNLKLDKKSFFKKIRRHINIKKRTISLVNMMRRNNHIMKNFHKLRMICALVRIRRNQIQYEEIINDIKRIIDEKNEIIFKAESDFNERNTQFSKVTNTNQNLVEENESLRRKIATLESKIDSDNARFRELWNQNVLDIKYLQESLTKNESLLGEAIRREEKLQHKYCIDIENAIKLNKQLNTIISKKNKVLADLKVKQFKNDEEKMIEQRKLYKENATLFDDYAKIIEIKEKEKRHMEEEKLRLMEKAKYKIAELEEEKIKSNFKAKVLENDNMQMFNDYISEIKKK